MTETIAAYKLAPTISRDALATISRAIRLRRRETRYVISFGTKTRNSQLEDSTHVYFTERMLGKVRDVLGRTAQPSTTPDLPSLSEKLASVSISDTDEANGISDEHFEDLSLADVSFNDEEIEGDFFLAIDVFMEDIYYFRQYVEYIWTIYKEPSLENNVCSLLTNAAIDFVRLAEQKFVRLVKQPSRIF
ncbi:hypothetical protein G6011_00216 [Alternaria panax]|uniref:DUF6604 domain-containing protein n=1 Tax=Alternaria panax TaxID=48097 RepID=A0AAD4NTD2_9PLEO|nr:hypothetical protein G6011_00216 [Alternaria panax]